MIAVDTNILVYAHRNESPWHEAARRVMRALAEDVAIWTIPWPCVHEFLAVTTNPKIYTPPTPPQLALAQIEAWRESGRLVLLAESNSHWDVLKSLIVNGTVTGARTHDARIAAICIQHGVSELWSADRDFSRFPKLRVRNPLVA